MANQNATNQQHLASTAQQYLDIADISNDLLILKDGSAALVMELSAINFGLLSEPEQDAIIYAYASLINSLSFPIQIVISSRPKDVSQYLEYIDTQLTTASSELRRRQISSYRQFVSNLITEQNVLDKKFFVVISLAAIEVGVSSPSGFINLFVPSNQPVQFEKSTVIEKALNILGPRRDHLLNQFARFGLRAEQLTTKELIHEFYVLYNGQAAEGAKIVDTKEYTTPLIQTYNGQQQARESAPQQVTQAAAVQAQAPVQPTPPEQPQTALTPEVQVAAPVMEIPAGVPPALPSMGSSDQLVATPIPGLATPTLSPTSAPQNAGAALGPAVSAIPVEAPAFAAPQNPLTQPR